MALKTLTKLHADVKSLPTTKREQVITVLGATTPQTFYDVINGIRRLNDAEKKAIAEIYDTTPDQIDWQDERRPIA